MSLPSFHCLMMNPIRIGMKERLCVSSASLKKEILSENLAPSNYYPKQFRRDTSSSQYLRVNAPQTSTPKIIYKLIRPNKSIFPCPAPPNEDLFPREKGPALWHFLRYGVLQGKHSPPSLPFSFLLFDFSFLVRSSSSLLFRALHSRSSTICGGYVERNRQLPVPLSPP